jgi:hypothetical protein
MKDEDPVRDGLRCPLCSGEVLSAASPAGGGEHDAGHHDHEGDHADGDDAGGHTRDQAAETHEHEDGAVDDVAIAEGAAVSGRAHDVRPCS